MVCAGGNSERSRGEHILGFNGIGRHVKCYARRQLINNGELYMFENPPYYTNCPTNIEHIICDVCNNFMIPRSDGKVEYGKHHFWAQNYCPIHEYDGTSHCCSCGRLQASAGMEYILLEDGRRLCPECSSFKIMDINDCQPLILEIQQFFGSLNMKLDQKIPVALVASETLNDLTEANDNLHHLSATTGLCLPERRPIPIVRMMESMGGFSFMDMLKSYPQLVHNREVDAILILYGLPRLLTGSILAHEMMHAWLHFEGYPNLSKPIEEGICEVVAHMWLKSKIHVGSETAMAAASLSSSLQPGRSKKHEQPSEIEKKLGECFIHQIETNNSNDYRHGFMEGNRAVSRYGLKKTLDCIKLYRTFPI